MNIVACVFRRTQKSKREQGIIINQGDGPIIDKDGNVVPDVYSWDSRPFDLCLNIQFKTKKLSSKKSINETVVEI